MFQHLKCTIFEIYKNIDLEYMITSARHSKSFFFFFCWPLWCRHTLHNKCYRKPLTILHYYDNIQIIMTGCRRHKHSRRRILIEKKIHLWILCFVFYLFSDINDCMHYPCQNDGNCTDGVNQFRCQCEPGFSGISCEISKYLNTPSRQSGYQRQTHPRRWQITTSLNIECKRGVIYTKR